VATNRPIVPAPGDYDDGEIGGMIGRGNWSTRRKPAPMLLCPPQTPHAAWTRTRAATVGSQRLTTRATARPQHTSEYSLKFCMGNVQNCLSNIFLQLLAICRLTWILSFSMPHRLKSRECGGHWSITW
jgi:hypothetical protein